VIIQTIPVFLSIAQFHYLSGSSDPNNLYAAGNALSLIGVGSSTVLENIEVTHSSRKGIGLVGGQPQLEEVLALNNQQADAFFSLGTKARVQTFLGIKRATGMQDGIVIENNEAGNNNTPHTYPVISNMTLIGADYCEDGSSRYGIYLNNNARADIFNSVVTGFDYGLYIDDVLTAQNTANNELNVSYINHLVN
jgi:hypothetical protein